MPAHCKKWYAAHEKDGYYVGVVYHYDPTGNKEIVDLTTRPFNTEGEALDTCVDWAEEQGFDVEME